MLPSGLMTSNCSADMDTNQVVVTDQSGRLGQLSVVKWTYLHSVVTVSVIHLPFINDVVQL